MILYAILIVRSKNMYNPGFSKLGEVNNRLRTTKTRYIPLINTNYPLENFLGGFIRPKQL